MMDERVGQILIAEPFMEDPNFAKGVVLLCDFQREHGTVGFILNKPVEMKVHQLVAGFPEVDMDVYFGGPVGQDTIHYVHTLGHLLDGAVPIRDGLYWGGDFETLKVLIDTQVVTDKDIKFFVGYAGWSPGQLKEELQLGSWVVDQMDNNYLINIPADKLWKSSLQNKSGTFGIIAEIPDSINWN